MKITSTGATFHVSKYPLYRLRLWPPMYLERKEAVLRKQHITAPQRLFPKRTVILASDGEEHAGTR